VGEEVTADLVVDAMGRGSATPQWLAQLGLDPPEVELIRAPVRYATSAFARPNCWSAWRGLVVGGAPLRRGGAVLPIEGGRWLVSLTGYFNEPMPTNHREFLEFSRSLSVPDLYEAICDREIRSEVVHHGFPGSQRRRYERLERSPERLIVLGDAACSFNPVYGQGMTVSALEAEQLDKMLARAKAEGTIGPGFARQWFRSATALIDAAWDGVLIEDFRFPELANERPLRLRLLQWYMGRVHRATYRSTRVTDQFYRVLNFMDPPATLFRPRIALDVLFGRPKIADTQPSGVEAPSGARPNSAKVG
jgi:2-polyprenyl-6-methoxyphenol hydroxylase-like FAD-dependent oxidoreductase